MIKVHQLLKVSVFMDAKGINASPNTVSRYLEVLKDKNFLPSIIYELGKDGPGLEPRLSFATTDNRWRIAFLAKRLDIEQHFVESVSGEEVNGFVKEAKDIAGIIFNELNRKGTRLAFITNSLMKEFSPSELSGVCNKLLKPIKFYEDDDLFEWGYRTVLQKEMQIKTIKETVNVITNVKRLKAIFTKHETTEEFETLGFNFDFNTIAENKDTRFANEELCVFIDQAVDNYNEIYRQLEELISG